MRRSFFLLLSGLLSLLAACDGAEPAVPPSLTDQWTGQVTLQNVPFTFELDLVESNTSVSGTGTMQSPQATDTFTVESGTYTHPLISLKLVFKDRPPINFSGSVTEDRDHIQGQLFSSGFGGEAIDFTRH